jgi:four helix bundle protein
MESSKLQIPSSKKAPSSKLQEESDVLGYWDDGMVADEMILHDGDGEHPFDFEERTSVFGEAIIRLCKKLPRNPINDRLMGQLTGCGTSVGANYCEANESVSKKDFRYSISRCKKEAKETKFFLRMIATSEPNVASEARKLYREATELMHILSAMHKK